MTKYNLISFVGIFVLLFIAWLFSNNRKEIPFRIIISGVALQLLFAGFIFLVPAGTKLFLWFNDVVVAFIDAGLEGARFLFGPLAASPGTKDSIGFILVFQALPSIVFFAALMQVLYYYNVLQRIVQLLARAFGKAMKITGVESLCAASNIFLGVDSLTTIRPYLSRMTSSELCTVLTCGLATIASSVLAFYVIILQKQFPNIAGHLVSASFISAPAALVMTKLMYPEKQASEIAEKEARMEIKKDDSLFEAIIHGANAGGKLVIGISILLLAVLGLVGVLNLGLGELSQHVSSLFGASVTLKIQDLLAYAFYPFTLVIGIPPADAFHVSQLLGVKLILTEVTAYQNLSQMLASHTLMFKRSAVIASYALCGFTHVASVAIFTGGIAALSPGAEKKLSKIAIRAFVAATLACLMTAAVAGTFYTESFASVVD